MYIIRQVYIVSGVNLIIISLGLIKTKRQEFLLPALMKFKVIFRYYIYLYLITTMRLISEK